MEIDTKKIAIFGIGGFAKEVFYCIKDLFLKEQREFGSQIVFVIKDDEDKIDSFLNCPVIWQKEFNPSIYRAVIAIGNLSIRKNLVKELPEETEYPTFIHPSALVNETVVLGKGTLIMANVIITCDVTIGSFCVIDRATNIGHDSRLGDFIHIAPMSVLSGNVIVNDLVNIGTQAAVKEGIAITSNVVIGMGGIVVKSIQEAGIYVGNPVKKIK